MRDPLANLARLVGTVVSGIECDDNQVLKVWGNDLDGQTRWVLSIRGSARFTFSHVSEHSSWLVEANVDVGGAVRSSEQAMVLAICGARVQFISFDEEGLFVRSDDGRAIEAPYVLNEQGIIIDILPDDVCFETCRIVLPAALI